MHFTEILPVKNLSNKVMIDQEKEEIYLQLMGYPYDLPKELMTQNEIYGIDTFNVEYCNLDTWKCPIQYHYDKESINLKFEECEVIEYSSKTLEKFMCEYLQDNESCDSIFDDSFEIEDIQINFYGHKVHVEQQNDYYENSDPSVKISFGKGKSLEDKMRYIHMIDGMLQLLFFQKQITQPLIKFTDLDSSGFITFDICDKNKYISEETDEFIKFSNRYEKTRGYLKIILHYLLKHPLDTSYFVYSYQKNSFELQKVFLDTYSVFDKLAKEFYEKKKCPDQDFLEFKSLICKTIEKLQEYDQFKSRLKGLKDKIMSHGDGVGHRRKLTVAMQDVSKLIPKREIFYGFNKKDIIDNIYRIRSETVHEGKIIQFNHSNIKYLEKLQWLTYALQIRRIGIEDEKLEDILDMVFGVG